MMRHTFILRGLLSLIAISLIGLPGVSWSYTTIDSCPSTWPDSELPVGYHPNENAPSSLPDISDVRRIFSDSFEAWTSPCCSSFSVTDLGTTSATADDQRDSYNVMSFREESWNPTLGDASTTLGVTIPLMYPSTCELVSADVVFNAYQFNFVDGNPRGTWDADLQSIATHEFGHFLGLGHTPIYDATMYAAYTGGEGARSLHQDDIDGVCDLYPQACSCTGDADCNGNQECIDGVCQIPPCVSNSDCDPGLVCDNGDCVVPPCESDGDCTGGYICTDGSCVPDQDCPICGPCSVNDDCGAQGICIPAGYMDSESHCTSWCQSSADCPGNTECFEVPTDSGTYYLCFNPDADTRGPCPAGYVCEDDSTDPDLCAGVTCPEGQVCNPATGTCQGGTTQGDCVVCDTCNPNSSGTCGAEGTCLSFIDGPSVCSVPCNADGSCPGNSTCFQLEDADGNPQNWCLNDNAPSAGICGGGWDCIEETPVGPCDGVVCPDGSTCNPATGVCGLDDPTNPDNPQIPDLTEQDDVVSGAGEDANEREDKNGPVGCLCDTMAAGSGGSSTGILVFLMVLAGGWVARRRRD